MVAVAAEVCPAVEAATPVDVHQEEVPRGECRVAVAVGPADFHVPDLPGEVPSREAVLLQDEVLPRITTIAHGTQVRHAHSAQVRAGSIGPPCVHQVRGIHLEAVDQALREIRFLHDHEAVAATGIPDYVPAAVRGLVPDHPVSVRVPEIEIVLPV